ncbi:MAG: LytR C-terminal domain-containing protein, partial [Sciscionella sp.]
LRAAERGRSGQGGGRSPRRSAAASDSDSDSDSDGAGGGGGTRLNAKKRRKQRRALRFAQSVLGAAVLTGFGFLGVSIYHIVAGPAAVAQSSPAQGANDARPRPPISNNAANIAPSAVTIQVLNAGDGSTAVANQAADRLRTWGFTVLGTQRAARAQAYTTIAYGQGNIGKARTLARDIPGARLRRDDSAHGAVLLMIANDFTGVSAGTR